MGSYETSKGTIQLFATALFFGGIAIAALGPAAIGIAIMLLGLLISITLLFVGRDR